eukprot:CAMPEP_0175059214 /NCGR_PEP_ID=MMETSP0052_2-20121109/12302_1 /TAXON_ID=51329 ORGANISM="Polytomella parva, Strain SAG 63-3" /NCGR_SAMPLE_ID=MMETSP0052_2 /ASSEMBLY_ACC=CAM_ASM_000194 /LENGTH=114 /DNA_ID=CAMNT_0016324727 /DNA_START=1 /DNA_END=342 /DNA_ORIENTATION=+
MRWSKMPLDFSRYVTAERNNERKEGKINILSPHLASASSSASPPLIASTAEPTVPNSIQGLCPSLFSAMEKREQFVAWYLGEILATIPGVVMDSYDDIQRAKTSSSSSSTFSSS